MKIADFFEIDNQNYWLEQIAKTDWRSGKYLYELLKSSSFSEKHGFVPAGIWRSILNEKYSQINKVG